MARTIFDFGKIDYNNSGRKINRVTIEVDLRDVKGTKELSICGNIWNAKSTDLVCCGQCLDELVPYFIDNELFNELYVYWKKYHLNTMHAGTMEQEEALKNCQSTKYEDKCEYLKSINMYEVIYNDKPYRYGSGWITYPIPAETITRITELCSQ